MLRSSANKLALTEAFIVSKMSLIARRNKVTASDDPWGIPFSCLKLFNSVLDIFI
jgi:hypothetical protein